MARISIKDISSQMGNFIDHLPGPKSRLVKGLGYPLVVAAVFAACQRMTPEPATPVITIYPTGTPKATATARFAPTSTATPKLVGALNPMTGNFELIPEAQATEQAKNTGGTYLEATAQAQAIKTAVAKATIKPTETATPTPEIKTVAPETIVSDLKESFAKAKLPIQFVKRSNGKDWNVFNIAGATIYSFGAIGPDAAKGITDGSQYPGLPLAKMQELVDKAMNAYKEEGGDPTQLTVEGIALPQLSSFVTLYTGTNIEAQQAMRAARNGKFNLQWREDDGGFTYVDKEQGLVIKIISQINDPYSGMNDALLSILNTEILSKIPSDANIRITPSRMYLMLAGSTGKNLAKDFNDVVNTINKAVKGKYTYSIDKQENLTLKIN